MPEKFRMPEILLQEEAAPEEHESSRKSPSRMRRVSVMAAGAGVLIGLVILWLVFREPMVALTSHNLAAARAQWKAADISSYDLVLETQPPGRKEPLRFDVQVRHGHVANVLHDGAPAGTHEPQTYAVDGLFDTLERELNLAQAPDDPFQASGGKVFQRVRFNDKLGYPERYLRVVGGSNQNTSFAVIALMPVSP